MSSSRKSCPWYIAPFHGIAPVFLRLLVGHSFCGRGHRPLHSPSSGHLTGFYHPDAWLGALVYIVVEVIPDAGLLSTSFQVFPRRRRIRELERAILDNPSAGNYEELGLLYLDDGDFSRARAAYDKAISSRTDSGGSVLPARHRRSKLGRFCCRRS